MKGIDKVINIYICMFIIMKIELRYRHDTKYFYSAAKDFKFLLFNSLIIRG